MDHSLDAQCDTARIIACPKCRHDGLVDDAIRDEVRQRSLEPAADFNAHASVIDGDEQQGAIVDALTTELPSIDDTDRVLLDFFGRDGRHGQHGDLNALASLERRKDRLKLGLLLCREHTSLIGHPRCELRYRLRLALGTCR